MTQTSIDRWWYKTEAEKSKTRVADMAEANMTGKGSPHDKDV